MKGIDAIKNNGQLLIQEISEDGGFAYAFLPGSTKPLLVIFSWGGGWDHVSVSHKSKCCTWDEMCAIKNIFFSDDECVVQYHPPRSEYINNHPYCLHLWKPQNKVIPLPPKEFV
jgi:hypothetical protein